MRAVDTELLTDAFSEFFRKKGNSQKLIWAVCHNPVQRVKHRNITLIYKLYVILWFGLGFFLFGVLKGSSEIISVICVCVSNPIPQNGVLLRTVLDPVTGDLSDTRTRYLGSRPVKLFRVRMQGQEAVREVYTHFTDRKKMTILTMYLLSALHWPKEGIIRANCELHYFPLLA